MSLRIRAAELRKQRAELVAKSRQLLDRVEGRELSPEEETEWQRMQAEIDALTARVEKIERQLELESGPIADDGGAGGGELNEGEDEDEEDEEEKNSRRSARLGSIADDRSARRDPRQQERRAAFWRAMRGQSISAAEARALAVGTDTAGGFTVPDEFVRLLVQRLEDENVMRRLATQRTSMSGESQIPVESDIGSASWTGEGGAYTESDVTFGQVLMGAHKLSRITKVSEELLHDSFLSIETYLADVFGRSFGRAEEAAMVAGDGTGKPTGVVGSSTKGADAAAAAITADNLLDLFHGLRRPYRAAATWLLADKTALLVRKLKDLDGQYLWQPGLQLGEPDKLLGRPVAISDNVPVVAAGAKSVLFGDFSHYWIMDRGPRAMQRLVELYAGNGQVGFRMFQRLDGKLVLPEAVVHLLHAAS